MEFKDWFFQQFPGVYQESDINKNAAGEGTFQRYLQSVGLELDDEIMPYIHNFMNIVDVVECDDKFLPLIAGILGSPPSYGADNDLYRKVLAYIVAIYKVKGTKLSYQILLGILGFTIRIIEETPAQKITYDQVGIKYDEDVPNKYDSACDNCSGYYIAYNINNQPVDQDLLDLAESVLCFLQPINAEFLGFIYMIDIQDTYNYTLSDEINLQLL
jgi:hypothetical protein